MAMVILFLFIVAFSWPLLWSWSYSCVPSCILLNHCHGCPFVFLVTSSLALSWSSFHVPGCVPPSHHHGCFRLLVFLVAFFLAITMVVAILLCSRLPLLNHHCGHPLVFLVVFILAIVVVMVIFLCSWLFSSLSLPWLWSSSCVLGCSPPSHCHGHPFMFLVALLLAITVVMVVLFCSCLCSSWPLPWPWFLVVSS
jgi:hypothetical protein